MFTKPTKRVRVTARNVHDGRSKSITLYDVDCEQAIKKLLAATEPEFRPKGRNTKRGASCA